MTRLVSNPHMPEKFDDWADYGRLIRQPWAEEAVGRCCFCLETGAIEGESGERGSDLREWIEQQLGKTPRDGAFEMPCLVWTAAPMNEAALSEQLAKAGFYPVQATLCLRVDAGHAGAATPPEEPMRLRLADFDTLAQLAEMVCQWGEGRDARAWHDGALGDEAARRWWMAELVERWRKGLRVYAFERCDAAPPLGMVGLDVDSAGRATLECFAVAKGHDGQAIARLDRLIGAILHRCFAQGRSIVEAVVPADDSISIGVLLDSGFSLQRAMFRWHGHFGTGG